MDKGYDYDEVRDQADAFRFTVHIRRSGEEAKAIKKNSRLQSAWLGGRTHAQLDQSLP